MNYCKDCIFCKNDGISSICELIQKAYSIDNVNCDVACTLYCSRESTINVFIKVHNRQFERKKLQFLHDVGLIEVDGKFVPVPKVHYGKDK